MGCCCINYINSCHVYGNKMDEKMLHGYSVNGNFPNYGIK